MAALSTEAISALVSPYYPDPSSVLLSQLSDYLDLLLRWNARTNLSAVRSAEEIVERHFGESLFAARQIPPADTLLDIGSGAGFPGLPIALVHSSLGVTLAESQGKKAAFLREAARTLGVEVEVWAGRVEDMPGNRLFDLVTLRAVDVPQRALRLAHRRLRPGGSILHLTTSDRLHPKDISIPGSGSRVVRVIE